MPANMKCVIDADTAFKLQHNNYFYVMHRFDNTLDFVKRATAEGWNNISISVGVQKEDIQLITKLSTTYNIDYITIDIAHGHCKAMREMIKHIRKCYNKGVYIIAGNIGTIEAYNDMAYWGVDACKVGIGPGAACTTRLKTGFYTPMFSTLVGISEVKFAINGPTIIADGGVKHTGDIAKALVGGADLVMVGGMFASCIDSPASVDSEGNKVYFGSASAANKEVKKHIEGTTKHLPTDSLTYLEKLQEITQDLQSASSYAGGKLNYKVKVGILH
jgi:GMP reductase